MIMILSGMPLHVFFTVLCGIDASWVHVLWDLDFGGSEYDFAIVGLFVTS